MTTYDAVDDFAGPGGWDLGARMIGLTTLGFELDPHACATAVAAGFERVKVDLSLHSLLEYRGLIPGYIASPPCTLFSAAGTGVGRQVLHLLADAIGAIFRGEDDPRDMVRASLYPTMLAARVAANTTRKQDRKWSEAEVEAKAKADTHVAALVLEPARRIMQLNPEWVALEQVPSVLPLWKLYQHALRGLGYSVWAGILVAADYGVAQLRERAVLVASRVRTAQPPEPTHTANPEDGDLFGNTLLRHVTMAEQLGWGMTARPYPVIASSRTTGGPDKEKVGGSAARAIIYGERDAGRWRDLEPGEMRVELRRSGERIEEGFDPAAEPSATTTHRFNRWQGKVSPAIEGETEEDCAWVFDRPSPTIVGSFRPDIVAKPGYRMPGDPPRQSTPGSVRITLDEAAMIQSFPANYPWQGNQSEMFRQIGNAYPPLMAAHTLAAITGRAAPGTLPNL